MDEKGFAIGQIQQTRAIVPATEKELFLRQVSDREWVSVIETISAAGESAVELHYLQSSLSTNQLVYEARFADLEGSYKPLGVDRQPSRPIMATRAFRS
jgi:hypothetical protein